MIIGTVTDAARVLAPLFAQGEGEMLAVMHLHADNRLAALTLHPGGKGDIELSIREVLSKALRLGAMAIVLAHNHPSGDPTPSPADEAATRALGQAAAAVEIRLFDHLIFAGGEWRSFRQMGLI